ncbi:tRNA (adenosine(37)-N6)-dimethylallyltransferase MiaA [Candidatus Tisiphia endosymbiont of Nedyus quadrimaculatus]|uniref:tRNA (adenosine(37)-N6)-dimethylallyltransferase MiaA n=1 Tax=Candidatus Tisiphia endosymbiont of Nedyus quadrimaculatus TaxID=3139332 RepID=UPI00345EBDE3
MQKKKMLVICGPTASGKSYLAHYLAKIYNAEIVNCDSMQIYRQIPIITASPSQTYRNEIPYHLYNFLSIDQKFSVIQYINYALEKITNIRSRGKLPIIVGGTGLYINSLLFGYNEIPSISPKIRQYVRELHSKIGSTQFFNKLKELDRLASQKLHEYDTQRVIRAYEVFMETGQSIFAFQSLQNKSILPAFDFKVIFLHPKREFLYQTCNTRLEKLFNEGAIEEVAQIKKDFPDIYSSAIKTIGLQEILCYLDNEITLQHAINLAQIKTRQYAKRQITWFKNQIKDKITLEYSNNQQFEELIIDLEIL